MILPVLSTFTS